MAATEIGEQQAWATSTAPAVWLRAPAELWRFARRKPLGFFGLIVVVLVIVMATPPFTEWIAPYNYATQDLRHRLEGPSAAHLLGTDSIGEDLFSRLVYGARVSIVVGFGATALAEAIGAAIGIVSAYYLGWFDRLFQRLVDIVQSLPVLVVVITILGMWGSGLWQLTVVLGVLGGPLASRLIRAQAIAVMQRPYVEGARVLGAGGMHVMVRHVLPNVTPLIILDATLRVGILILVEATLSFLGYGVPPPFPSWGQMLSLEGRDYMRSAPWLAIYPGIAIGLTVYAFNVLGDALRDVLDPRLRGAR